MSFRNTKSLIFQNHLKFPFLLNSSQRLLLHSGPDTIEELLDRHVVKDKPSTEEEDRRRLTSTRREALSLYRDIIRASRFFTWSDSRGVPWREILRMNARKEFEEAKFERDPEVVTRLLIGGRDAVEKAVEKLVEKHRIELEKQQSNNDRR